MNYVQGVLDHAVHPVVAVVGGAKVRDKIALLRNLVERYDTVVIGGKMAFTFLASNGVQVNNDNNNC
jgi:phosphoglycerate kinase